MKKKDDYSDIAGENLLALGIKIAAFYDDDGDLNYSYDVTMPLNTTPLTEILGVLEYIKLKIAKTYDKDL
jgi:hypothetical protein